MRRLIRTAAAAALLLAAACDRDATGPGGALPQAEPGRFVLATGDGQEMEGEAWIDSMLGAGREVWMLTGAGAGAWITPPVLGSSSFDFQAGRHSFGVLGPVNGFVLLDPASDESFIAVSGVLRVTSSDAEHVIGEFDFTAEEARTRRSMRVRGNFHALPLPLRQAAHDADLGSAAF